MLGLLAASRAALALAAATRHLRRNRVPRHAALLHVAAASLAPIRLALARRRGPVARAAALAVQTVRDELTREQGSLETVRFVCFSEDDLRVYREVLDVARRD